MHGVHASGSYVASQYVYQRHFGSSGGHSRDVDFHGGRGSTGLQPASCREASNGVISLHDAGKDDGALYRDTYAVVVTTCGPASPTPRPAAPPSPVGRAQCSGLAAAMVDLIEDDKMESAEFVRAREAFAVACTPR